MKKTVKVFLVFIPIILFILISICIQKGTTIDFENRFYTAITKNMTENLIGIMKFITHFGSLIPISLICVILLIIPKLRKTYGLPITSVISVSGILSLILKNFFQRPRPSVLELVHETTYSFPSGHSMNNMTLYFLISLLFFSSNQNKLLKTIVITCCIIVVILIGISRVYLGAHYVTDVIAGWCMGIWIAIIGHIVWKKIRK